MANSPNAIQALADNYAAGLLPGFSSQGRGRGVRSHRSRSGAPTQSEQLDKMLGVPKDMESLTPEQEKDLITSLKEVSLGGLSAVGSLLDVPGSMIRDVIVGENPFDQLLSMTSFENRATGRDVLEKLGMRPNVESGLALDDPGELGRDVAGFGAEVALDPLTYMSLGIIPFLKGTSTLTKGGRAVQSAGLLDEAADVYRRLPSRMADKSLRMGIDPENAKFLQKMGGLEPHHAGRREALQNLTPKDILEDKTIRSVFGKDKLDELSKKLSPEDLNAPLGGSLKWSVPFTQMETIMSPTGGRVSKFVDQFERYVGSSSVGRLVKGAFDYGSKNLYGELGQKIAQNSLRFRDGKMQEVSDAWAEVAVSFNAAREAVEEVTGGAVLEKLGRSRKPLGADALVKDKGGVLRELRVGDYVRDLDNTGAYIVGHADGQAKLLRYTKSTGEYVVQNRPIKALVEKNKNILPEGMDASSKEAAAVIGATAIADDASEVLLMKMLRMLKEVSDPAKLRDPKGYSTEIWNNIGKLQVRDVFHGARWGTLAETPIQRMFFEKGRLGRKATEPIRDALQAIENFESKFKFRFDAKGGNIGDIGRDRFFFAPRRATPAVRAIKRSIAKDAGEEVTVQQFGQARKTQVLEEDALSRDMDIAATESRDPAISNLPVFVIERMINDAVLSPTGKGFMEDVAKRQAYLMDPKNGYSGYIEDALPSNKIKKEASELTTAEIISRAKKRGEDLAPHEAMVDPEWPLVRDQAEEIVRARYLNKMIKGDPESGVRGLTDFIMDWGPKTGLGRGPMFMTDFMLNYRDYFVSMAGREAMHDAVLDAVANDIRISQRRHGQFAEGGFNPMSPEEAVDQGVTTVGQIFEQLGHKMEDAPGFYGQTSLPQNSLKTLHGLLDDSTKSMASISQEVGDHLEDLASLSISKDLAKQLLATRKVLEGGEFFEPFVKTLDSMTAMFKGNVTLPFPAFASRNLISGQFVNFSSGFMRSIGDINAYREAVAKARRIGRDPSGHYEQIQQLRTMKVVGHQHLDDVDYVGNVESAFIGRPSAEARITPGKFEKFLNPKYWRDNWRNADDYVAANPSALKSLKGEKQMKELNYGVDKPMQGLKQARKANRAVLSAGSALNQHVEFLNRVPFFYYLQDHLGFNAAQAAAEVRKLQFDYGRLTAFEKKYMRRAIPFYAFTRKMAPLFFEQLMTRPGGLQNQMIRLSRYSTDQDTVLPSWMGGTMQVRVPGGSFISGLGLAHEDTLQYLQQFGKGPIPTLTGVGTNILSRLNPLMAGPLQAVTGRQFFSQDPSGVATEANKRWPLVAGLANNIGGRFNQLVTGEPFLPSTERPDPLLSGLGLRPEYSDALEAIVGASPASRYFSTLSSMLRPMDEDVPWYEELATKAIKGGTGIKLETLEDYQLDRAKQDAMAELIRKEGIGAEYANAFINREKLIEEMHRSGIMGTELDQLPDRYRTAALLRLQLKELSARKRERSKALRDEKRRRIGVQ